MTMWSVRSEDDIARDHVLTKENYNHGGHVVHMLTGDL